MVSASDYVLLCTHELVDGLAGLSASIKESFEKMTPDDIDAGFESFMLFVRKEHARLAEQLEASASAEAQRHRDAMRAAERRFESKVVGLRRAMETRMRDITAVLEHQRVELEEKRDAAATALAQAKQDKEALDIATTRLTALEVACSERKNQKAASLAFGITMLTPPGSFAMKDGTAITATEDFLIAPPAQAVSEEEPQAPASNFIDFDEEQQKELIALRHEVNTLRVNIVTERTNAQAAKEQVEVELKQAVAETSKLSAQVRALSEDLRKSREAEARLAQFLEDEKESHAGSRLRAEKLQTKLQREIRSKLPRPQDEHASGPPDASESRLPRPAAAPAPASSTRGHVEKVVPPVVSASQPMTCRCGTADASRAESSRSDEGAAAADALCRRAESPHGRPRSKPAIDERSADDAVFGRRHEGQHGGSTAVCASGNAGVHVRSSLPVRQAGMLGDANSQSFGVYPADAGPFAPETAFGSRRGGGSTQPKAAAPAPLPSRPRDSAGHIPLATPEEMTASFFSRNGGAKKGPVFTSLGAHELPVSSSVVKLGRPRPDEGPSEVVGAASFFPTPTQLKTVPPLGLGRCIPRSDAVGDAAKSKASMGFGSLR